jgi:hypothetical protein
MEIVQLNVLHYIYLIGVLVVLAAMIGRKDTVLPCILFTFLLGFAASGSIVGALQTNFNALTYAGSEFFPIIATIAMVVAMSKSMADMGTDVMLMNPIAKAMKTPDVAFFALGIIMAIVTMLIWPSPAVALIGAIMTPVAIRAGLPAIGAAIAMNIFGHGFAFAFDPIIQGAPGVTASSAGITPGEIISAGAPMFTVTGIVAILLSYFFLKKDMKANAARYESERKVALAEANVNKEAHSSAKVMAVIIPVSFVLVIAAMIKKGLVGGDATALVSGTAIAMMTIGALLQHGPIGALEAIVDYVRDGFGFGMKIFAPVVIIGGYFFIGGGGVNAILGGEYPRGLLMDWGWWLAQQVPLSKYPVATLMLIIGGITGLDGSGFSGLPLVGSMAVSFGEAVGLSVPILAALGQMGAQWIGGGTIIPWAVIPVAAMCGVDPGELARRNTVPVLVALLVGLLMAFFIL